MKGVVNHRQQHTVTVTRALPPSNVTIVLEIDGHFGAELQECQDGKVGFIHLPSSQDVNMTQHKR